jgi:hypothetical protein
VVKEKEKLRLGNKCSAKDVRERSISSLVICFFSNENNFALRFLLRENNKSVDDLGIVAFLKMNE